MARGTMLSVSGAARSLGCAAGVAATGGRGDPAAPARRDIETGPAKATQEAAPLDGDLIRRRWRSLIGRHPPKTLSHALMDRILVWREQIAEVGDCSPRSRAILAAALSDKASGTGADGRDRNVGDREDHGALRHGRQAPIRVGTVLVREHAGVLHRVAVVADGFEWDGRIYASLSAVARAITGVRWNGRRFFALDRGVRQAGARKSGPRERSTVDAATSDRAPERGARVARVEDTGGSRGKSTRYAGATVASRETGEPNAPFRAGGGP